MVWRDGTFSYQPALDGVRGLAVAFVLAFHLGIPWATGGYLGVSVFFTLSGYLITSLLLSEHERTGRIDFGAFYLRRARRLLPAALLCITAVTALVAAGVLGARSGARAEILSAVFEAANWHALLLGRSYADLFIAPSALAHFWSLAIEEQFYVVWPIVFAFVAARTARRGRPSLSAVLVVLFVVFGLAAPITARLWSADAAYYASWARFGEILAGAALASLSARRSFPARTALLAPVCLAAIVVLCITTPAGTGWAYTGGLPLFAVVTAGLIAGLQTDGPVRSLLSARPLVRLGVISYGVYLFHWPVFVVLDEQRTGLGGSTLIALRLAVTLAVASNVYAIVEHPVRARAILSRQSRFVVSAVSAIVVTATCVALVVPDLGARRPADRPTLLVAATRPAPSTSAGGTSGAGAGDATPAVGQAPRPGSETQASPDAASPPRPTSVAVFGDSVPDWLLRDAAPTYARTDFVVVNAAHEGCDGAVDAPTALGSNGAPLRREPTCQAWPDAYPAIVDPPAPPVDIALLAIGEAPVLSHLIAGRRVGPCDDMRWYTSDVEARIDFLKARVHAVVVALPAWGGNRVSLFLPADHEARLACVRDQLRDLALRAGVSTIDLADILCPGGPNGDCPDLRQQDGLHVDPEDAPMVLGWILDRLRPHPTERGAAHSF